MKRAFIIILSLLSLSAFSFNRDSLIAITQSNVKYIQKCEAYSALAEYYLDSDIDSAKYFVNFLIRTCKKHKDNSFQHISLDYRAIIAEKEAEYEKALSLYKELGELYKAEKNQQELSESYKKIARVYDAQGQSMNAIQYYLKSSEIKEKIGDYKGMASIYNGIASLYYAEENYKEALRYYHESLSIADSLDFKYAIGVLSMNIGNIYNHIFLEDTTHYADKYELDSVQQAYYLAVDYYKKSLDLFEQIGVLGQMANLYDNLGALDSNNTLEYFKKSYEIRKQSGDIKGQFRNLNNIGGYYLSKKHYKKAKIYTNKAKELADEKDLILEFSQSCEQLSEIEYALKNYELAYEYLDTFKSIDDSLKRAESEMEFAEYEKRWNYTKRENENKLLKKDNELIEAKNAKQAIYLWASGIGLLLFGILIFVIFRGYRQKQKANQLLSVQKKQIEKANDELNLQNEEISAQKEHIEEIHRDLSQSIDYAKRLQRAILPKEDIIEHILNDHFVLFMPKDKVSGDFYWWTSINGKTVVTAADCTGHGVPGAFMSMLGVSFLKEIVNKGLSTQPALILNQLREEIIKTLDQKGVAGEQKDGMDMALVSIDNKSQKVEFAGANNPLYIVSKTDLSEQLGKTKVLELEGVPEKLYEVKPDKMPIAIYEKMNDFSNHTLNLSKGDMLYMFSDGFADQFGGPKGKKFMYKPFKRLLLKNATKSTKYQHSELKKAFFDWIANEEQIDDVVVIGIRL